MSGCQRLSISAAALLLMLPPAIASAASHNPGHNMESLELRSGVIVNLKEQQVYLMSPEASVDAIDIGTGETLWVARDAAKPLAVGDGVLVCQAVIAAPSSNLDLVILNAEDGQPVARSSATLPSPVVAQVDDTLSNRFAARALTFGDEAFVTWEHQTFPARGMPPLPEETGLERSAAQPQQASGTVKLDLRSGEASLVRPEDVPEAMQDARPINRTSAAGAPPDPSQRISIDDRHTLKSALVGDDSVWDKYRWTIVDNETGDEIGQLRSHFSQSAFVVVDSLIIFETGPLVRNIESELAEEPLMLRAVDLDSGQQIWSQPVRETEYRGPFPP